MPTPPKSVSEYMPIFDLLVATCVHILFAWKCTNCQCCWCILMCICVNKTTEVTCTCTCTCTVHTHLWCNLNCTTVPRELTYINHLPHDFYDMVRNWLKVGLALHSAALPPPPPPATPLPRPALCWSGGRSKGQLRISTWLWSYVVSSPDHSHQRRERSCAQSSNPM